MVGDGAARARRGSVASRQHFRLLGGARRAVAEYEGEVAAFVAVIEARRSTARGSLELGRIAAPSLPATGSWTTLSIAVAVGALGGDDVDVGLVTDAPDRERGVAACATTRTSDCARRPTRGSPLRGDMVSLAARRASVSRA